MHLGITANVISPTLRLFLTTGLMGGFTTYSAFDYGDLRYTQQGAYALAALNVDLTLVGVFRGRGGRGRRGQMDILARMIHHDRGH